MTTRRWAWKQPSFEESVIAHWSSSMAPKMFLVTRPGDIRSENADMSNEKSCEKHDRLPVEEPCLSVGANWMIGPRAAWAEIKRLLASLSDSCASRGEPASSGVAFHPKHTTAIAECSLKPVHSREKPVQGLARAVEEDDYLLVLAAPSPYLPSVSEEKTSNWEGDPPGELTVPQTDTGEQVEYTRALERTMSKELGKMTP
ncbi:hypothetical protein Tco_0516657 [Tanacetum coccineum]